MTLPPVIRIFFAIDLPTETKEKLGKFIGSLKKRSKSHAIRWSRPENLHVTLQFLAEAKSDDVTKMMEAVRASVVGVFDRFQLNFGGVRLFPNPYRPRVIVLDIAPQEALTVLAGLIGHGIAALGYELESRAFRAHLTIGRIKHPHGLDLSFLAENATSSIDSLNVTEVALFRSEPQPEGSNYTVLEKIQFG